VRTSNNTYVNRVLALADLDYCARAQVLDTHLVGAAVGHASEHHAHRWWQAHLACDQQGRGHRKGHAAAEDGEEEDSEQQNREGGASAQSPATDHSDTNAGRSVSCSYSLHMPAFETASVAQSSYVHMPAFETATIIGTKLSRTLRLEEWIHGILDDTNAFAASTNGALCSA